MVVLTFAEQVKLVLSRRNMTIKQLAEEIEEATGMKMSRQNLTQRLSRDNFQEKDMRMIAEILGCKLHLTILDDAEDAVDVEIDEKAEEALVEEIVEELIEEELLEEAIEEEIEETTEEIEEETEKVTVEVEIENDTTEVEELIEEFIKEEKQQVVEPYKVVERVREVTMGELGSEKKADTHSGEGKKNVGEINPYTLREYDNNTVRTHPKRIGYVQVYDRDVHGWTEMTEWAYLAYQERQRRMLGKNYQEPIFLD